jgi:hypothetical protein
MNRRSFISGLVKACAAASVAANLVREEALMPAQKLTFDPSDYAGEYRWINTACAEAAKNAWTGRFQVAYKDLADKQ